MKGRGDEVGVWLIPTTGQIMVGVNPVFAAPRPTPDLCSANGIGPLDKPRHASMVGT